METTRELIERFLEGDRSVVLGNPRLNPQRTERAQESVEASPYSTGHLFFGTSGTSTPPKWVGLSRAALESSARAVTEHLRCSPMTTRWGLSLPCFHVGGAGILFRSSLTDAGNLPAFEEKWEANAFADWCRREALTHTSLVPTQVHDLVTRNVESPPSLETVLVGGGHLSSALHLKAIALGWPILTTYGMSEGSSQIATQTEVDQEEPLPAILPIWETRLGSDDELEIRGPALFSCYLEEGVRFHHVEPSSWFSTGDAVAIDENRITWKGRLDSMIKILGERVLLDQLERTFQDCLEASGEKHSATLVAIPDPRQGHRILAVFEGAETHEEVIDQYHEQVAPFEKISDTLAVEAFPRSPLGKILRGDLAQTAIDRS